MGVVDDVFMSPTYTLHAARAIQALLEIRPPHGTYHVVNSGGTSWYTLAKEVEDLLADAKGRVLKRSSSEESGDVRRPKDSRLAMERLKRVGISMPPWEEALREYLYAKGYL